MSFGFMGIQFGFALQNANTSRIFQNLGAKVDDLPILWIAAPVTGLIVQPIIGYLSDRTWHPTLGRRRPYFLVGAILASLALCVMPNSPALWVAAGVLWLMDASINVSMEPFRAFVGDNLPDDQRTIGFAMQSFFIGIGAVVGSALPYILSNWMGITDSGGENSGISANVKWSFYIGGAIFLLCVLWTVFRSKEYSPEQLKQFGEESSESHQSIEQPAQWFHHQGGLLKSNGLIFMVIGLVTTLALYVLGWKKDLYILTVGVGVFGLLIWVAGYLQRAGNHHNTLVTIMNDLWGMPNTMKQLAWVQFFSWFALFSMWIYSTPGITSQKYNMSISALELEAISGLGNVLEETERTSFSKSVSDLQMRSSEGKLIVPDVDLLNTALKHKTHLEPTVVQSIERAKSQYGEGADWIGILFSVYNGASAILAFLLVALAASLGRRKTHAVALVVGAVSFVLVYFIPNPQWLIVPFIGVGLVWSSILSMPYAILTGALPSDKMGYYMGVFNFFIVIPQIVAAALLGFLVQKLFDNQAIFAYLVGAGSFFVAALLTLRVEDKTDK